jgi:hypothetical protein
MERACGDRIARDGGDCGRTSDSECGRTAMAEETESRERPVRADHLPVSEFTSERPGPLSPFGEDVEFPLPPEKVAYVHPGPDDHPALAGER